ncbi:MAG: glycosyltransferase [Clostridia bacterium]|nr:glycosyltransferase [Clostridia bacterium]
MKRVGVVGHFAFGKEYLDGQTVKTKVLTKELQRTLGEDEILTIDTHGGRKRLLQLPFLLISLLRSCKNIIILPARNGLRVIAPLLVLINIFFHRKLHYVVIGGWLPQFLKGRCLLAQVLKRFSAVYVETKTMKKALEAKGFSNVVVMPNCKYLPILSEDELVYPDAEPYKLCTFSRVMKEKGIEDAVNAVQAVNAQIGRTVFSLDIYGQIDPSQVEWFEKLNQSFPEYVRYAGMVPFDQTTIVLKGYFALLFPTRFYTEGIPGTVIDAYAAGVPVIASRWESFDDIVKPEFSGIGYSFFEEGALEKKLHEIIRNIQCVHQMRLQCLQEAQKYIPQNVINTILERLF